MLANKINDLQHNRRKQDTEIKLLRTKLNQTIANTEKLQIKDTRYISTMVTDCSETVKNKWPDKNSFQRLFWEEQIKFNKAKTSNGMRWHPMIIKWCLHMKTKSTATFDVLHETGFVKVPSKRTLYNYSHFMEAKCGVTVETLKHLKSEATAQSLYEIEFKKYVFIPV